MRKATFKKREVNLKQSFNVKKVKTAILLAYSKEVNKDFHPPYAEI